MAGGVTAPASRFSLPLPLPLLLLLLLLLPAGSVAAAAAAAAADAHCIQLVNYTTEHGHRRSDVRVDRSCGCEQLSLSVRLNASGMPVKCSQKGTWHSAKQSVAVSADGLASVLTVVEGCFQARCTCADGRHCHQDWDFEGLNYYEYNLVISAEQLSGDTPRLSVQARPDKNATQFYFPRLEVRLYRCPRDEHAKAADTACSHHRAADPVIADASADMSVDLAGSGEPLTPGRYRLEVLPYGSWVCQGSNNGCKRIELFVTLSATPDISGAVLPAAGDDRLKVLYAVIGVTLAVIAAGLVFLWRECSAVRTGQGAPFTAKTPAPSGAQVLLVHLWAGQRLAQLKTELRDAGLQVTDFQERKLAALLRTMPVADVLTADRLRHAKIVFLCSERALQLERTPSSAVSGGGGGGGGGFSSAAGGLFGHEALFSAVLHCVRNSALAHDYQRVFVVLPEGGDGGGSGGGGSDDTGGGLSALVPGCRFRWPTDGPELVRQLNLAPAETDRERVV